MIIQERKKKENNKDNSTHINSNSITYIIRKTSIQTNYNLKYIHVHIHKNRNTNKHRHTHNSLPP